MEGQGWLDEFAQVLAAEGLGAATVRAYEGDVRQWLDTGGGDAERLADHLSNLGLLGRSRRTLARKGAALRRWARWLRESGRREEDIARLVVSPKRRPALPVHLVQRQVEGLINAPDPLLPLGIRDRALWQMIYEAGLRASEALGLTLADLDLEAGEARVVGKGGRERVALFGPRARAALRAWLEGPRREFDKEGAEALFLARTGKPLSGRQLRKRFAGAAKDAGLGPGITPHALRHAFATHLLQAGCDIRMVQRLLGHRQISTTQVYTHLAFPDLVLTHRACHPRA